MRKFASGMLAALAGVLALAQCAAGADSAAARVSVLPGTQVIQILDATVDWYRALGTQQQNATQPSDLLILFANRQTADKVVSLAFDIARANAELLSSEASSQGVATGTTASQSLSQKQAQLDAERQGIQQEMASTRQQLARAGRGGAGKARAGQSRVDIEAKLSELQGELAMADARKNLLDTMTEFVRDSDPKTAKANSLKAQIDAIAATVPAAGVNVANAAAATVAAAASASSAAGAAPTRFGVWDLGAAVFRQRNKIATIEAVDQRTAALADTFRKISVAPLAQLKAYEARSNGLASQADHVSGAVLKALRNQFDTLAWLFKQTSQILLPLGKEQVLLQQYRHNLGSWREAAQKQYHDALAALGIRLGIVAAFLAAVFALGEVWRRAVLRYAHDSHRRYQMMLVRTIVLWTVVLAVVCLSFVTRISTFATFAGLFTAGLAVAMQSVLVSVVGYFFLIGKYGIRVGDRIQIGTVVGEVLDIGLVRLHLRELNQQGPLGPTGRIVGFANLIVFQASSGLFKQSSDADFAWHETVLPLPAASDYAALKLKLLAAVLGAVGEPVARPVGHPAGQPGAVNTPQVQMRLAAGRMEALIRYPVNLRQAADIDERVAQAVLSVTAAAAAAGLAGQNA